MKRKLFQLPNNRQKALLLPVGVLSSLLSLNSYSATQVQAADGANTAAISCPSVAGSTLATFSDNNNEFLLKLGFGDLERDFSTPPKNGAKMAKKIEGKWLDLADLMESYKSNNFYYNQMSRNQLERNIESYKAVKAAKELALQLGAIILSCDLAGNRIEQVSKLVAYLAALKPMDISDAVKARAKSQIEMELDKAASERTSEVDAIVADELKRTMHKHTEIILNDIMTALYGNGGSGEGAEQMQVARQMRAPLSRIVRLMYMDHQIGRTRWLGRALIGLMEKNSPGSHEALKAALLERGIVIENIVGETWKMNDEIAEVLEARKSFEAGLVNLIRRKQINGSEFLTLQEKFEEMLSETYRMPAPQSENGGRRTLGVAPWVQNLVDGVDDRLESFVTKLQSKLNLGQKSVDGSIRDLFLNSLKKARRGILRYQVKQVEIPVHNMSYVLTRNINIESAATPSMGLPANEEKGREFGLIGSLPSAINVVDAEYVQEKGYGLVAKVKDRSFYRFMNDGYSHIGFIAVRRADNVSMTWVIDNYPTPVADSEIEMPNANFNAGGVRWIGLEQFYKPSQHTRVVVITPDPQLFHEWVKPQIDARLVKIGKNNELLGEPMYPAMTPKLDPRTQIPLRIDNKSEQKDDPWVAEIDNDTFKKIHNFPDDKEWFDSVAQAAVDKISDFMYKGMSFVWITPYGQYYKGGAYCSFTGVLGWRLGTGLDVLPPPKHKDHWHPLVLALGKTIEGLKTVSAKTADKGPLKELLADPQVQQVPMLQYLDVYTPSGLPAQDYVKIEDVHHATAPYMDVGKRYSSLYENSSSAKGLNLFTTTVGAPGGITTSGDLSAMPESESLDPSEVRAVVLDILEVATVKGRISIK